MGGTLAVTIRDHDGVVHRMARWTNPTPFFINNLRFIEKDREHLKSYLDTWHKMRADWVQFGDSPQNPSPMSGCYATDESMVLAPQGYGLLVIDYVTGVVLHRQNYTTYGAHFLIGMGENGLEEIAEDSYIATLYDAGKLRALKLVRLGNDDEEDKPVELAYSSGMELVTQVHTQRLTMTFDIDMSPWQIVAFQNTREAWQVFRQMCDNLIGLTDQDKAAWEEWFDEREDDYPTA